MLIRPAFAPEAELLTDIHRESFHHYWNSDAFSDFFSVQGTLALVAEISPSPSWGEGRGGGLPGKPSLVNPHPNPPPETGEGIVCAMAVYRIQYEQSDIITLAVRPEWRRKGIARTLLDEILRSVREKGAKSLFLDVEEGNRAAIALYEAAGFHQIGRRKLYYRQKDGSYTDALVMSRKLGL